MADGEHPLDRVPDIADAPLDWDPSERRFRGETDVAMKAPPTTHPGPTGRDPRRITIAAPAEGTRAAPPPRRVPRIVAPTAAAGPANRSTSTGDRSRRRLLPSRTLLIRAFAVVVLLGLAGLAWGYAQFQRIDRIDLGPVLASGNGTNYLIVGSDSRAGVDPGRPDAAAILGDDTVGGPERSDTMLILRVDDQGARMLSIPRDLWVTVSETGQRARINSAFNGGPQRLVATITDQLGLPVHHYLQIDFVTFGELVDSVGGITIDFPHPAFDTHSGLEVTESGPVELDGTQALAYVRSRFYTEVIDGRTVAEGTGDLGRVQRQQKFLSALMDAVTDVRNPVALARISASLAGGMRVDSDLGYLDALALLRRLRGLEPATDPLPTSNFTTGDGAQVLRLQQPDADRVLADFGSPGAVDP